MKKPKAVVIKDVSRYRNEFKKFVQNVLKGKMAEPVKMVNNGYLHTLNASFDGLFLREQKSDSLLVAHHPMNFGTIQPCIRTEDKQQEKRSLLHLGLFNICGYSILDFQKVTPKEMAQKTIREFYIFYIKYLHLNPELLRIYIFGGGTLREITNGIIQSDQYIKPDDFSVDIWKKFGVGKEQFIKEYSKETYLLHLANPLREHHVGYRNDIFMQVGDVSYEVATLNFISHQTIIEKNNIIGIKKLPFSLREMAVGQERILAATTGSNNIYELPYVKPLLNEVKGKITNQNKALAYIDALRVIHYFFSDGWVYEKLKGRKYREHRHELNKFMEIVTDYGSEINKSDLKRIINLNTRLQPWDQILTKGIDVVIEEIEKFKNKKS